MTELIVVTTTTEKKEDSERIARRLVEDGLAACVQIQGPIVSIYRWEGKVETAAEWICTMKTQRRLFQDVESAIYQLHPYDVPEIIAVPVVEVSSSYLKWAQEQIAKNRNR